MTAASHADASHPHRFRDPALARLALTHSSTGASANNERLEFLGDAVLDLLIAEKLFHDEESHSEGEMTSIKSRIVSRASLAEAAKHMRLDRAAIVGPGLQGRALPRSVMANVYEAVLGAVYLDAGLEAARHFVHETLRVNLVKARDVRHGGNPKQELQQLCQRRWGEPPEYLLLEERGRAHARAFLMTARAGGRRFPSAWGRTRKEAQSWAAHEALLVLQLEDESPTANAQSEIEDEQ